MTEQDIRTLWLEEGVKHLRACAKAARLAPFVPGSPRARTLAMSAAAWEAAERAFVRAMSGTDTDTDREIAGQITRCASARQGLMPIADPGLPDIPLEEMLAVIRRVHNAPLERDADGTTVPVLCDPRIVAALYVLDAYEPSSEPVVWCFEQGERDLGRGLFVARLKLDNEEDEP